METFIDRLESALKKTGISQKDLAEHIGIRRPTISDWKKNGAVPSADICLKIADFLHVSFRWLVAGVEDSADTHSENEKELFKLWGEVSEFDREELLVLLRYQSERQKKCRHLGGVGISR